MNKIITVCLAILASLLIIVLIKKYRQNNGSEHFPTTTYVNTPKQQGEYPTSINDWWGGNYYYRLNWTPWGYHHPNFYYNRGPYDAIKSPYINYSVTPTLADTTVNPTAQIPAGNAIPIDTIRWNYPYRPMLTSVESPKDYALGQWVYAGTAYTSNPNDFTYLDVYQLNIDPGRELFNYAVKTKDGQIIPLNLRQNHKRLEDGDRFKVQGMEGRGDFIFSEADKYTYVYV